VLQEALATITAAPGIAELVAPELGWTPDEVTAQVRAFVNQARADLQAAGLPGADVASLGEHP
jgi:hypothetical protein